MHLRHLPFLRERHHGAGQASYSDAGRRGHPPYQFNLSPGHLGKKADGCPLVALGSDVARQSKGVRRLFKDGIRAHFEVLDELMDDAKSSDPSSRAMAILSLMVGAVTLSRTMQEETLSQGIFAAAAGEVRRIAHSVTRFKVGNRAMTTILPNWISGPLTPEKRTAGLGGPAADGILAELLLLDAQGLVLAPHYLSDVEASTLPTAALTAWHAITRGDGLRPEADILVGGTGGVSLFALQIGVAVGARVLVTSSSAQKLDQVKALGAFAGVNYRNNSDWANQIVTLTDGRGVDLAIDIGGASSLTTPFEQRL